MRVLNARGKVVGTFALGSTAVFEIDGKEIQITEKSGEDNIFIYAVSKDGRMIAMDACGNMLTSSLTEGGLFLNVKKGAK